MFRTALRSLACCASLLALTSPADAQINWNVTYLDGNIGVGGTGFADPTISGSSTVGQLRRDSVSAATTYLNTVLDGRGTVNLTFDASSFTGSGFLAQFGAGQLDTLYPSFQNGGVYQAARTNQHPFAGSPDGSGQFNFGYGWNYTGQGADPAKFDMVTVAIHEVGHALGFSSFTDSAGRGLRSPPATLGDPDNFSVFDRYIQRGNGTGGQLFNTTITDTNFASFTGQVSTLTNQNDPTTGLYFGGKYTREILNGPAPLYAPATYQDGSSTSHVNDTSAVMNPSVAPDAVKRFQPYEIAMLMDVGWNVYNWNGSATGNWGAGISGLDVSVSNWRTDLGIVYDGFNDYNVRQFQSQAPILPPSGQVTSNIVLNFGGSSTYTATNDIGTIRLSRLNLNSTAGTPTIAGGTLNFGQNSDGSASVLVPKIVQQNSGEFVIASNIQTNNVATQVLTGNVEFLGSAGLTIDGTGSGQVTLSGVVSGDGSLTKAGTFTTVLSGNNTYSGGTTVSAGVLLVNGQIGANSGTGSGAVTVNGGTFGGTGRAAGAVTANSGGNLAPGDGGVGTLTLAGGVTLTSGATYAVELNGNALANYDHLSVTGGTVTLGDATLVRSLGYTPNVNDKLFILVNDPGVTVSGTFNGLAQGDSFLIGGTTAYISYVGDADLALPTGGNDVVILFAPVPVPEPAAVLAIACGALLLGRVARRRWTAAPDLAA